MQGGVRDAGTAGALSSGLLANTATLHVTDGGAFDVTIPLTGCALLRGGPHVGCRWTNGVAQLVRLRDGSYKFVAVQRALPESSTGSTTPIGPATAVLQTGAINQVDSIPASFCRTLGAYTLHCFER